MPPADSDMSQIANSSSDFVRKLYKMLEDPQYNSVVRWGNAGDSFVVLENEKFTKAILPKHFKHSNFASFVRQLNKYDFHKVRHSDESGVSPYGQGAWEFKHPEFNRNRKDNLDNIRRKAPAARKVQMQDEPFPATQQLALLNDTLTATQHQVQALQEQHANMVQTNKILCEELASLQKMVKAQYQVHTELINHLNNVDEKRRRNSRHSAHSPHTSAAQFHHSASATGSMGMLPDSGDEPAAELRRAREILNNVAADPTVDHNFERLSTLFQQTNGTSPPESAGSSSHAPAHASGGSGASNELHLVYPVGQNAGIDPFHADHIKNIPYTRPLSNPSTDVPLVSPPPKELAESLWGVRKPKILLVEDDKVCARIGAKFLSQVDCVVEIAKDGSEAVAKVNQDADRYDLIFMDIIMPVFDGVSATACIRIAAPRVPIVAMTSNIRSEDIATYFHWGMNDVLAKPFTKEGMVRILRKHLPYLLKNPPPPGTADDLGTIAGGPQAPAPGAAGPGTAGSGTAGYVTAGGLPSIPSMQTTPAIGSVKFETPIQSPATSSSWNSPSMDNNGSYLPNPINTSNTNLNTPGQHHTVAVNGSSGRTPAPGPYAAAPAPPGISHASVRDQDDRPEKRQRLYGPGQYP